jgi:SAM-dependent methyltransferase
MPILALCPSRNRPHQANETLDSFLRTRKDKHSRLVFIVDEDDETIREYPQQCVYRVKPTGRMGGALALATADASLIGNATSVGMIGDDNRFRTMGWDQTLDDWLSFHVGIAYPDDGFQHERLPTNWWISRKVFNEFGLAHPGLHHLFMDNYWQSMGEGAKCIRYFPDILIEHLHPLAGKSEYDEIYERGNSSTNAQHDRAFFEEWKQGERRNDVRRLRGMIKQDTTINVLADYHHPALYESLAILFEDRFKWRLFRPIGSEWKSEEYWSFINLNMKLDWSDYLAIDAPRQPGSGFWRLANAQYPKRPHKGVTLYQARAMDWGYVVASVWQNQEGFARFADEQGATFVHQIGNAKHNVNWDLPAKYLVSTTMDIGNVMAVKYHQEFDTRMFKYEPPTRRKRISNFSCRFDWEKEAHQLFVEAGKLAPEIKWTDYGSLYGDLVRQEDVAEAMRDASFIWHDKPMGDGFGHVIHNAASVGRPLIGHASYYKGKMAEVFWRDGETCIDLDQHDIPETIELIRDVLDSPRRHNRMCEAIAQAFRDNVNFAEEARQIKNLLSGRLTGDFYDVGYFVTGKKSSYCPYGPGGWAGDMANMVRQYLAPDSVLDVGAAYGFVVAELEKHGVKASGFDISPFAISRRATENVWIGSVDDRSSYRQVDLILGAELVEHLIPEQAKEFLEISREFCQRMLLLIGIDADPNADGIRSKFHPGNPSHVNVRPMWWWNEMFARTGWKLGDASRFNSDARSKDMRWAGRFVLLEKGS